MRRLALALVASAVSHAAVLANAPFSPGAAQFALSASGAPLEVRLQAAPAATVAAAPVAQSAPPKRVNNPAGSASDAGPAAGLPAPEIYFRGKEVDERAEALNSVEVEYPPLALAARVAGKVTLRLMIDHLGALHESRVLDSEPPGVFDAVALKAVRALKFKPALRQGRAVGSIKVIEVPFEPDCNRNLRCAN